jgi:hypothetical protein
MGFYGQEDQLDLSTLSPSIQLALFMFSLESLRDSWKNTFPHDMYF